MALLLGSGHYFVLSRLWGMIPSVVLRVAVVVVAALMLAAFFAVFIFRDVLPLSVGAVAYRVGTSWLMIFLYLLLSFLTLELLRVFHFAPASWMLSEGWGGVSVLSIAFVLVFSYGYFRYRIKKRLVLNLEIAKPAGNLGVLKIVALSDLHLGYGIGKKELESWLPLVNAEKPDIVFIVGDVVDNNVRPLFEQNFAESFKKIESKYGIYGVVGNHEYLGNLAKSVEFFKSAGITLLRDTACFIDEAFYIIGRDDRSNPKRKKLSELTAGIDRSKPVLLLDHQPYHLEDAVQNGVDLQISGHTHNGQIWPVSMVTRLIFEKSYGYTKKGGSHIYVSSGIGIWGGKFRIGTWSEYVVITLSTGGGC
jgi:predicted MPP superfamily phosphohydrolase